jgi:hypothetical protein
MVSLKPILYTSCISLLLYTSTTTNQPLLQDHPFYPDKDFIRCRVPFPFIKIYTGIHPPERLMLMACRIIILQTRFCQYLPIASVTSGSRHHRLTIHLPIKTPSRYPPRVDCYYTCPCTPQPGSASTRHEYLHCSDSPYPSSRQSPLPKYGSYQKSYGIRLFLSPNAIFR